MCVLGVDLVAASSDSPRPSLSVLSRVASAVLLLFVFLLGVKGLGDGFKLLGQDLIGGFFAATEDPFVGLIVGLLATTLMQSSSVTTSMIVGLVAAPENPLPLANAVPMIMGANIGTTVTATIVSLAHMGRREEFERAFPVAICHDIFNYLSVLALLPIEIATGFLRRTATLMASSLEGIGGFEYESPLRAVLGAGFAPFTGFAESVIRTDGRQAVFLIGVSGLLIFFALYLLVRVMRKLMHTRVERIVNEVLGSSAALAILVGIVMTVMVQSSSITTSVLVPLAAAGLLRLEQAFPITIGANVGTTVTAFLAALGVAGPNALVGLEIALVHLLFNVSGTLLIYPIKVIRRVPLAAARAITRTAVVSRKMTVLVVAALFYGVPAVVLLVVQLLP